MAKLRILHNETCPICAREVGVYRRHAARAGVDMQVDGLAQAPQFGQGF